MPFRTRSSRGETSNTNTLTMPPRRSARELQPPTSAPAIPASLSKKITRSASNTSHRSQNYLEEPAHVHAIWENPIMVFAGLTPDHWNKIVRTSSAAKRHRNSNSSKQSTNSNSIASANGGDADQEEHQDHDDPEDQIEQEIEQAEKPKPKRSYTTPKKRRGGRRPNFRRQPSLQEHPPSPAVDPAENVEPSTEINDVNMEDAQPGEPADVQHASEQTLRPSRDVTNQPDIIVEEAEPEEEPPQEVGSPDPIDEELAEVDLPQMFLERPPTPAQSECDDHADWIMKKRFAPMADPQQFIAALTKHDPTRRSTDVLFTLAMNTQQALEAMQDEFLTLDARTAPHGNPPKKPSTGARAPVEPAVWEDMKEAELYHYAYDPKKAPGEQNPFAQRLGGDFVRGRELRRRGGKDAGDAPLSEDDGGGEAGAGKRTRKAVVRYDGVPASGGRGRKRNLEVPESDLGPRKRRGRPPAGDFLPQRIKEMRGESVMTGTSDEEAGDGSPGPAKRRGRPPGIKSSSKKGAPGVRGGAFVSQTVEPMEDIMDNGSPSRFVINPRTLDSGNIEATPDQNDIVAASVANNGLLAAYEEDVTPLQTPPRSTTPLQPYPDEGMDRAMSDALSGDAGSEPKRKQRVKSEKRSQSMTAWWASRKEKQAKEQARLNEERQLELQRKAQEQGSMAKMQHSHLRAAGIRTWEDFPHLNPDHPENLTRSGSANKRRARQPSTPGNAPPSSQNAQFLPNGGSHQFLQPNTGMQPLPDPAWLTTPLGRGPSIRPRPLFSSSSSHPPNEPMSATAPTPPRLAPAFGSENAPPAQQQYNGPPLQPKPAPHQQSQPSPYPPIPGHQHPQQPPMQHYQHPGHPQLMPQPPPQTPHHHMQTSPPPGPPPGYYHSVSTSTRPNTEFAVLAPAPPPQGHPPEHDQQVLHLQMISTQKRISGGENLEGLRHETFTKDVHHRGAITTAEHHPSTPITRPPRKVVINSHLSASTSGTIRHLLSRALRHTSFITTSTRLCTLIHHKAILVRPLHHLTNTDNQSTGSTISHSNINISSRHLPTINMLLNTTTKSHHHLLLPTINSNIHINIRIRTSKNIIKATRPHRRNTTMLDIHPSNTSGMTSSSNSSRDFHTNLLHMATTTPLP
ncbi:hypothetical protein K402DRAFT_467150 [Aulographum hederae CBS 113979]|uniref:Uncharacterized protein n=1 Tax=Aulographum hederae CBS 113979 TaxID=1176131 RepID=A0A6G1GMF3_9PEZI|nr:hypothetical protein K402DRAFT_467150 [Aulographum hederae CBS 113979]